MSTVVTTGYERLGAASAHNVDSVCDRFEKAWRAGEKPIIEAYLTGSPGDERSVLIRELLLIETPFRRRAGDAVHSEEYRARFPEIDEAWLAQVLSDSTGSPDSTRVLVSPPTLPTLPGYEIECELGRGGMGVVYRARDLELKRTVAIKMVLGGGIAGPNAVARFLAEAEVLAALHHPNIVQVYDRGQCQGLPYFVMEYCPGGSLGARVRVQPLPARPAAELVERLARGVAAAHANNILHRDLKPENILFAADGAPKITDFGLAKRFADSGEAVTQLTVSGMVMGTPSYMAPEQALGDKRRIGPAADIYALGAILYRLVAGRPPSAPGLNDDTVRIDKHDNANTPTTQFHSLPRDLATICQKCLRYEPAQRYASANEFADDLRRFLEDQPIQARRVGTRERIAKWMKRNPLVTSFAGAMVLALVAGTTVSYLKYRDAKEHESRANQRANEASAAVKVRDVALQDTRTALGERDVALADANYMLDISNTLLANAALADRDVAVALERLERVSPEQRKWEWHYLRRQCEGGIFTIGGHTDVVAHVAYSPDGARLASGGWDNTVRVWNARTGDEMLKLTGHKHWITCVAFSPDGTQLATASLDRTVKMWNGRTGQPLFDLKKHKGGLTSLAFSPDGDRLATGSEDNTARIWDAKTGASLFELKGHYDAVRCIAFSPDGTRLATGSVADGVKVWDSRSGTLVLDAKSDRRGITSLAFSPSGKRLITGNSQGVATVWDAPVGRPLFDLNGHTKGVASVAYSPDGMRIITASHDRTVRVWDAQRGAAIIDLKGHRDNVFSAAFSPDGTRVVTASADKTVKVWDATTGVPVAELRGHRLGLASVAFAPDGSRIATASGDKTAIVWDARSRRYLLSLKGHTETVHCVAFSPDGTRLATSSRDNTAKIWDARTGQPILELTGHADGISQVVFSPDGKRVATGSWDRSARLWDATTGSLIRELPGHGKAVKAVAFSLDGSLLATADDTIRLWNAGTGVLEAQWKGHERGISCLSYSPDGAWIATGGNDKVVRVWHAQARSQRLVLNGHKGELTSLTFNSDGTRLITASDDGTVKIWETRTGTPLLELAGQTEGVASVAVSPDGSQLVTASVDGVARIWDTRAGKIHARDVPTWDAVDYEYRLMQTRPNFWRYYEFARRASAAGNGQGVALNLDRCLSLEPRRLVHYKSRDDLLHDPRLTARASFHQPELAKSRYDRGVILGMAVAGDHLAKRLVAQEYLREGKGELAIPLLYDCMLTRPRTDPPKPPVEELLLSLAYRQMNQLDEAERFHRAATEWLDRPRHPMCAANIVTHAINPWNAIGEAFKPIDDPRFNPFDWESWHECDVFRAQVEKLLQSK